MISVPVSDFLRLHGGLVRMLQALEQAGPSGLPTNEASLKVFNSRYYGWRILRQASELGYIIRERLPRSAGGHYYIVNKLTDRGRRLLRELDTAAA